MIFGEANSALTLWERLRDKWRARHGPFLDTVATRFVRLFEDHGVHRNQIPRFLSSDLKLSALRDNSTLLEALSDAHLDAACELFGTRREWLEGASGRIYETNWCYKAPERLLTDLARLGSPSGISPLRAVATNLPLNMRSTVGHRIELVLVETAGWLGEQEIPRFRVFSGGFNWAYQESRHQIKAMVRAYGRVVPLYQVTDEEIEGLYSGQIVPKRLLRGSLSTSPSLEDYCMRRGENFHAKDLEELDEVYAYMREHQLDTRWGGSMAGRMS